MARIERSLGRYRDWPQLEAVPFAALAAGSATDPAQDIILASIPDLTQAWSPTGLNQGISGDLPSNRMWIRQAAVLSQGAANTAGNATNNAVLLLNAYRKGVRQGIVAYYPLSIATTLSAAVTGGSVQTVAVASATGIVPGLQLGVDSGANFEVITVLSVSGSNITAYFGIAHNSAVALTSVLVPFRQISMVNASGPVSTTSGTAVGAAGSATITPASMYGIHVGDALLCDTGGSQETVIVTAVTATTFTATFANTHSSGFAIVTALTPTGSPRLANGDRFELQPGDVLAINRLSNNTTGIATPASLVQIEWVPSQVGA